VIQLKINQLVQEEGILKLHLTVVKITQSEPVAT